MPHGEELKHLWNYQLEKVHISDCEELLCVSQQTQNNCIHGEKRKTTLLNIRSYHVLKYKLKKEAAS